MSEVRITTTTRTGDDIECTFADMVGDGDAWPTSMTATEFDYSRLLYKIGLSNFNEPRLLDLTAMG